MRNCNNCSWYINEEENECSLGFTCDDGLCSSHDYLDNNGIHTEVLVFSNSYFIYNEDFKGPINYLNLYRTYDDNNDVTYHITACDKKDLSNNKVCILIDNSDEELSKLVQKLNGLYQGIIILVSQDYCTIVINANMTFRNEITGFHLDLNPTLELEKLFDYLDEKYHNYSDVEEAKKLVKMIKK